MNVERTALSAKNTSTGDWQLIYLALGTNLGDRQAHLLAALQQLRAVIRLLQLSSIYETEPVGYLDQPRFLNMVCAAETRLSPQELLTYLKSQEIELGRQASFRNGPRTIDIDILLYDKLCLQEMHLVIPHPRMQERAFVLIPLVEIAPELVDPRSGQSVSALLAQISQQGVERVAAAPLL